jgi:5-methylcytosine-specific restriction endonuclease McrA
MGSKFRFTGKNRNEQRKAAGLCRHCEVPATVGTVCLDCWFCQTAWNHLRSNTLGPELKKLWEVQGGRCAYTGIELIPGPRLVGNASLDHRVPLSKGGTKNIENTQWVLCQINRMKTDMTEDEFYETCETIIFMRSEKLRQIHQLTDGCV